MKSNILRLSLVGVLIVTMLLAGGCFNSAPQITSLTPSNSTVASGGSCTVSCVATDADGNTLTYSWSASDGSISGTGSSVSWTAPTAVGSYTVTVSVSDGKAAAVSESCTIQVTNNAPVIANLMPSATNLAPGADCTVNCVASDADGDTLSYDWSATDGTISGTGSNVTWTAPVTEGNYTVSVTVADGKGGTDSDSCNITVEMKYGAIDIQSNPDGAAVYLDGVDTGNITPYVITGLAPGTYTLRLEYYHYDNREQTVTVAPNETTYINWSLDYAETETLTIQPSAVIGKDTFVYDTSPEDNFGEETRVVAGSDSNYIVRAYLEFNLDLLPEDAVILSAKIGLCYYYTSASAIANIGIYPVLGSWTETGLTWDNQPVFATTAEDTTNIPAGVTDGFHYWYITDLAKSWWDGSQANFGVMLRDSDESSHEAWKRFYSSDWTTAGQRPVLIITYYVPTS